MVNVSSLSLGRGYSAPVRTGRLVEVGAGWLAVPVREAQDLLASLPAGFLHTASSLESEHPFHQLEENLAGFEHTGRGKGSFCCACPGGGG